MEYNSPEFRKWLNKLQQESWQLELIISGFAIYGLISSIDTINAKGAEYIAADIGEFAITWFVAFVCVWIFIFNLVLHVLLRGLWIGAIGLRYVSGDIDYNKLNYSDKFTTYLQRKVGSFDKYISRLENYCSILFSITFLLVFYFIGFVAVVTVFGLIINTIKISSFITDDISKYLRIGISIVFGLSALIVFIDFIGQGFLKKKNWTTKLYFPIYWIFSKLTLSFLYRPITYNLLDNKLGKRVSIFLLPIYLTILFINSFNYYNSNYLVRLKGSTSNFADNLNYEDEITKDTQYIDFAAIPSKTIQTNYLKVFMSFSESKEDFVYEFNDDLKPDNDTRGLNSDMIAAFKSTDQDNQVKNKNISLYLKTINQLYSIKIDSVSQIGEFILAEDSKQNIGFETYLDIEVLPKGKHLLTIHGPKKIATKKDSINFNSSLITIPFWYFPQNVTQPHPIKKVAVDTFTNK